MKTTPATQPATAATKTPPPKAQKTLAPAGAQAAPSTSSGLAALCCLAAAVVSGGLLWMCYHPLAWGLLGWVAVAPLLVLVRTQTRPIFVYLIAFTGGLAFYVPALSWMSVAHSSMVAAWIALAIYCALYFPIAIAMIRAFDRRRVPLVVSMPLVWVALEYLRCHVLSGFPWYLLAHSQHDLLPMIQITDLGGVFLVSLIVAAANAVVFDIAYQHPAVRRCFNQSEVEPFRYYANVDLLNRGILAEWLFRRNLIVETLILAVLLLSTYAYGMFRLRQDRFFAGPTVCLLQSNLDQRLREGRALNPEASSIGTVVGVAYHACIPKPESVEEHFARLCVRATTNMMPKPDLVIWPETSFPSPWYDVSTELPVEQVPTHWRDAALDIRFRLEDLGKKHTQIPHLLGVNSYCLEADGKQRHYNSALLLNAKGNVDSRFDKVHRVPFGEYIPLKDWLPFLAALSPYEGDFGVQPGEKLTRFTINKHSFGVLICFEDTDPFLARRYVQTTQDGPPVDFLVNISNDGWFDGSAEHEEHLAVSRFRAIECRRSMVRAVNMGVSAVIDSNGRVMKPTFAEGSDAPLRGSDKPSPPVFVVKADGPKPPELRNADWRHFKNRPLVLAATVPIDRRTSFYAMTGDVLPITCWAVLLGGAGWILFRRRFAVKSMA